MRSKEETEPKILTRQAAKRLKNTANSEVSVSDLLPHYNSSKNNRNSRGNKFQSDKLDTNIFQSYLEGLWDKVPDSKRSSCEYLDCLWFSSYLKGETKAKALGWVKKKHIFTKRYVFVPIICWSHWSLLILCNFGEKKASKFQPCMLLLDSLQTLGPKRLEPEIRRFVLDVYKTEGRKEQAAYISKIPLLIPKVPQQTNGEECGTFVLYFINQFMYSAPETFTLEGYPYFLSEDWFTLQDLDTFRKEIHPICEYISYPLLAGFAAANDKGVDAE